ncbi:MAG TPA: hypothetical protein VF258_06650 [Luteolibacter sp.]
MSRAPGCSKSSSRFRRRSAGPPELPCSPPSIFLTSPWLPGLRANPQFADRPCGILTIGSPNEPQEKLRLMSINQYARDTGIHAGWPLNRALVRCPDLSVIAADPASESAVRDELIRMGEMLGPDVEVTACDSVTVDLSSRSTPVESSLEMFDGAEFAIWHARSITPDLAALAARHQITAGAVVTPEDLKPLPLSMLDSLPARNSPMSLLRLWGLATLGDFMDLPRQALAERLGPEAAGWHDLLNGKSCRLLRLHRPPASFAQSFDFEEPAGALDQLVFPLKRLLHTLAGRLASRHLAANRIDLTLVLESGEPVAMQIRLPEPQTSVEAMLSPLQAWLASLRLGSAVATLELDAGTTFATSAQQEWFGRHLPEPARFAETLAKLDALLGPGRVGIPSPADTFQPDGLLLRPATGSEGATEPSRIRPDCSVPLHRFRPPRRIAVAYEDRPRHPWPLALLNGPHTGEIVDWRGPFSVSGDWWNPTAAWSRLEWDIQLCSRHLLRLVFQPPDRWQLDGIYP